jgi:hypothetical protein
VSLCNIDRRTCERDSTNQLHLTGKTWDELDLRNLPRTFQDFVDLVQTNPYWHGEDLVAWGQRILNLCGKGGIEYPKVFLKRIKDAERIESAVTFPKAEVHPL